MALVDKISLAVVLFDLCEWLNSQWKMSIDVSSIYSWISSFPSYFRRSSVNEHGRIAQLFIHSQSSYKSIYVKSLLSLRAFLERFGRCKCWSSYVSSTVERFSSLTNVKISVVDRTTDTSFVPPHSCYSESISTVQACIGSGFQTRHVRRWLKQQ